MTLSAFVAPVKWDQPVTPPDYYSTAAPNCPPLMLGTLPNWLHNKSAIELCLFKGEIKRVLNRKDIFPKFSAFNYVAPAL